MRKPLQKHYGFTLIELALVIGLLGLAFGITSDILISLVRSQTKTSVMNNVEQQANFVLLKLEKELRNAEDVELDATTNGLKILDRSTQSYKYYWFDSSTIKYSGYSDKSNSVSMLDTASPGGVVASCIGSCLTVSATTPKIVNINIKFSAVGGAAVVSNTASVDIIETIVVRGTY